MNDTSRRKFLKSAGVVAAPAVPSAAKARRRANFSPSGRPQQISENLYVFEDTCQVYVIRDGSRCVLIDFGSGRVLDHLAGLGIGKVDYILHTHHHRDQCQGDHLAAERGIPIAVAAHEKHLFADAENFWRNRRVYHLYYVRNDFNTITENVPVAKALADYSTFRWNKTDFLILPAPGHTLGSIALLAAIDGKKVAFSGDLMYSPVDELHGDICQLAPLLHVVNGDDAGVGKIARGARFPEQPLPQPGPLLRFAHLSQADGLDCHRTSDGGVYGMVHHTHRAAP